MKTYQFCSFFFDQEAVGSLGSQVWAEYYNIGQQYTNGNIVSLSSIDLQGSWKPFNPIHEQELWKKQSSYFSLPNDWLVHLLTPTMEVIKKEKQRDEL